ncbi:TetR/AcrR family transcriptional regulator [Amycolatopsis balhimycina DSM 5908]|uniref:TetR/AcrR family transcriptional regulator n=1 Tax=Amycolatopsis balhimycina DSM 5908 TaxID=1081091 RepID=A0A428W8I6_AMYBA|nr:TetR/AcrR family transcriptional regulator [Amycolatopsis balhimycina]RSM39353.1 TetR/AcrR family transcriptional regulator [Amycolatopsis balhimycina DSM 5908]
MTIPERRRYDSPVREARARRTRAQVIATAGRLFAERGYAGTSMRQIAAAAGVSLETVTQTGRKPELLLAAFRDGFAGDPDAVNLDALAGPAGPADLPAVVSRVASGVRGSLPIWRAFTTAAAADPAVAAVRAELALARRAEIVERLEAAGMAASDRLADAIGLIASHEAYDHLTGVCGWGHEEYVTWAAAAINAQLTLDWGS